MKRIKPWLKKLNFQDLVPFIAFFAIFLFFTISSYNPRTGVFVMLTARNLGTMLDQTMMTIVVACGTIFVVAQGSTDMSVGVTMAFSGIIGAWVAFVTGIPVLLLILTPLIGFLIGVFNGVIVSKFKVSSFMLTLAMLIGVRGLVNFIQVKTDIQRLPEALSFLNYPYVKIPIFLVLIGVMAYLFEFTKLGRYSRAIGENETTALFVGVPVNKMKVAAFALSGLMAAVGALFSIVTVASTSQQMGVFLEIRVVMAIYLGGVLVTGGTSAKFYKILLGSFSIQIIVTGLALMGKSDSHYSQSVQGILLLLILLASVLAGRRRRKARALPEDAPAEKDAQLPTGPKV